MKTSTLFAASALLGSAALAMPLDRRDIVWVTTWETFYTTLDTTQTLWVDAPSATEAPAAPTSVSAPVESAPAVSSQAAPLPAQVPAPAPAPAPSSSSAAASQAPAPAPAPAAPSSSQAAVAPAPAPAPATSTAAPAPAPAPVSTSSAAPPSSGAQTFSGDITYYAPGLGSCGETSTSTDYIVALSTLYMINPANPNDNPLCGKTITISYGGVQKQATVVDTCEACSMYSIDLTPSLFQQFAPLSVGRVSGVEWWFN